MSTSIQTTHERSITIVHARGAETVLRFFHMYDAAVDVANPVFHLLGWVICTVGKQDAISRLSFTFPYKLNQTLEWETGADTELAQALADMWHWREGQQVPLLPKPDEQDACPSLNNQKEAVRRWREEIMPMSACIIQGLYCPDGQWAKLSLSKKSNESSDKSDKTLSQPERSTEDWYDKQWAFAAATLVRGWLAFYAREDAPHDRQHTANHLLLWRIYALVLIGIVEKNVMWSDDQTEELERAVGKWLRICQDEASAWLFLRQGEVWWGRGCEEHTGERSILSYREYRRELEVNRVVEALVSPLTSTPSTSSGTSSGGLTQVHQQALQAQLEQVVLNWYLPRYDVKKAEEVQYNTLKSLRRLRQSQALAQVSATKRFLHRGIFRIRLVGLGTLRLWAAIGTGYAATALQSDTWTLLYGLVHTHVWGFLIGLCAMAIMPYGYLVSGIHRKVHDIKKALYRALWVWGSGEIFALVIGKSLFWVFAPLIPMEGNNQSLQAMCDGATSFAMILLYAQIALFFGIFIQLIFDEKPTTAPLDAP